VQLAASSLGRATSATQRRLGVPVGPVAAVPDSSQSRRCFFISSERRAIEHGNMLDLQLKLNGVPGKTWLEAFDREEQPVTLTGHATKSAPPRIRHDTIYWSIDRAVLIPAWWHLNRCVDRANAALFSREGQSSPRAERG
jgi:hypothetical protein